MFRNWHRQATALAAASSGSRAHDAAGRIHRTVAVKVGPEKWRARCGTCREWVSGDVVDKRTAEQAVRAHERKVMK